MDKLRTLHIHRTECGYLCRIVGRGTVQESPTVRDLACKAIESGADVVFDLSQCEYLDSTFLGCLVILNQRATLGAGSFAVLADDAVRRRLLHSVRLEHVLTFTEKCPECLGEPVEVPATRLERRDLGKHLLETHRRLAELGGPASRTFQSIVDQLEEDLGDGSS